MSAQKPITPNPPIDYPHTEWVDEPGQPFYVAEALRADYVAADVDRTEYARDTPLRHTVRPPTRNRDGFVSISSTAPVPFESWAYSRRIRLAEAAARMRATIAKDRARYWGICRVCGLEADARGWPRPSETHRVVACPACAPTLAAALARAGILPDGRTRGEAADTIAAELRATA
ncbi:hypothetical protein [Agromyces sp. Marseille-Q5079]|uniref:hypothetical protein n=1 Tax=Agromyces sp. Marseille-Q5079 TaxID=3439059 RepID=UPI003D9CB9A0